MWKGVEAYASPNGISKKRCNYTVRALAGQVLRCCGLVAQYRIVARERPQILDIHNPAVLSSGSRQRRLCRVTAARREQIEVMLPTIVHVLQQQQRYASRTASAHRLRSAH